MCLCVCMSVCLYVCVSVPLVELWFWLCAHFPLCNVIKHLFYACKITENLLIFLYLFISSSLLAALSSGNRVYYVKKDAYTNNYSIKLDITQKLYEYFRANDYKDKNINENICETRNKLLTEFDEYKRRQYYLAITGIYWCPCSFPNSYCEDPSTLDRSNQDTYALLCGCNKLGMLIIWKVNIPTLTDELTAEFLESIAVYNEQATTVAWHQDSLSSTGDILLHCF